MPKETKTTERLTATANEIIINGVAGATVALQGWEIAFVVCEESDAGDRDARPIGVRGGAAQ